MRRQLGRTGTEISAMGLGCWAIGGPLWEGSSAIGWGEVDDTMSLGALRAGIEAGITFLDTADNYGAGHSERVVGQAVRGMRDKVVIATKFGNVFDEATRRLTGQDSTPEYALRACEASLRRLGTDYIDLYFFHMNDGPREAVPALMETLERLVQQGKIRSYGWSTDHADRAALFAPGRHCAAIEHDENVLVDNPGVLRVCEDNGLASINRAPLAMGLLTGKFGRSRLTDSKDVRGTNSPSWLRYFQHGTPAPQYLARLESIREILTSGGRTLAQGSLAWIWARSPVTVPIPGFRTAAQVAENVKAMERGPLSTRQMSEIHDVLSAASEPGIDKG